VSEFFDQKVRGPVDERVGANPHGVVFQGQLYRAIAWLRSLGKLNHPADFQAVAAAARALFEGAVDVTLMHFDPSSHNPDKMGAWEESAKLRHAQSIAEFLDESGREPTAEEKTILTFLQREKVRIERLRLQWWPGKRGQSRHPPRWTGSDLSRDSKAADRHLPAKFEEFYRLRYPQICWNVHGSSLAGVANIAPDVFPFVGGRAYKEAATFASVIAEVVTREVKCWNESDFVELRKQMEIAAGLVYRAGRNSGGSS
jgi:hypothetical protein